jgi:hypothetical protein
MMAFFVLDAFKEIPLFLCDFKGIGGCERG